MLSDVYLSQGMQVMINGRETDIEEGLDIEALLSRYKLKKEQVVVELNQAVPEKRTYAQTFLRQGDSVEIVKFMGGG